MTILKSYTEYDENGEPKIVTRLELDDRFEDDIHYIVISEGAGAVRCDTLEEAEEVFKTLFLISFIE